MKLKGIYRQFFTGLVIGMVAFSSTSATVLSEAVPTSQSTPPQPGEDPVKAPESSAPAEVKAEPAAGGAFPEEGSAEEEGPNDPLELLNRFVHTVNFMLDLAFLRPLAEAYRAIAPEPVRNGVRNVIDHLFSPVVFLNHVLQGEAERATITLARFIMNSTIGCLGLIDAASELGHPRYDTDLNQTLAAWGIQTGPYLVLPLIGPSSFRGAIGFAGDYYSQPLTLYLINPHHRRHRYWLRIRDGMDLISYREKAIETLDNLEKNSLDLYATLRSIYFQRQKYMEENLKSSRSNG
jgi:phospholipid-binding lipoprotein MlaA